MGFIGGLFSTVVPFLLALHAAASDPAPVYGQMANSSRIYAYSPMPRSFEKSVAYCESLWMQPVSIHSEAENEAVAQLIDDDAVEVYIGGKPACANDALTAAADYRWTWTDDSAFDFQGQWAPTYPGSNGALFIFKQPYVGVLWGDKAANDGVLAGVVCAAPSPAAIRGALPTITRLGGPAGIATMNDPEMHTKCTPK